MGSNPQPLSIIADVNIVVNSPQVNGPPFNQGLFTGTSSAIPSYGTNPRIRQYLAATFSTAMIADGFTTNSPEYICMQMYFSQSPQPQSGYVGRQDLTAIFSAIPHSGNAGTGYVVGDLVTVTQVGASNGVLRVASIGGGGAVATLTTILGEQGTGYSVATALATTGGTGTGLEVDITAIGETCLQALQVCRAVQPSWYAAMCTAAVTADHEAISAWVLSQVGTVYFGTTQDTSSLNGLSTGLLTALFNASSKRTWMQWASTQSGLYPNQIYFTAAVMGCAMAANTQLANSAFTMKFSAGVPLEGVFVEPLTTTQIQNIEGVSTSVGPNGNLYINYANSFNVLEQGTMSAANQFFDEILNLDILASNIQYNIMNLLTSVPKVPQTDAGQAQLIQAVEAALAQSALTGFIAGGVWEGQNIPIPTVSTGLTKGTTLPNGYWVASPKVASLSQAQIQARQAAPIYVALIEAGAVHFVTISVQVQR